MSWLKQLETLPKQVVVLVSILFVTLIGLVDYSTGYETFFFTFYLLAIFWGTWRAGALMGGLLSALSVTAWVSANAEGGAHYSNYFIPVWNAAIMFTIYLIVVALLARLKRINVELEERVQLRTKALKREIQERMRLQKQVLEFTDREQRRIGRELHDGLCQHLTGTALAAHLLAQRLGPKSLPEADEAARLVRLIEEAIEMTRSLSHQLDPVELKTGQLKDRLTDLAELTRQRFKSDCEFECQLVQPIENAAAMHLYRIAHDAVNLALKHEGVKRIQIGLGSDANDVVLSVTDDGSVPPHQPAEDAEVGRTMNYRADAIGATVRFERPSTGGTKFTCVLPFAEPSHDSEN